MILMIDWGNTHLKFIKCFSLSEQDIINGQLICVDTLSDFDKQTKQQFDVILIASVRNEKDNEQLLVLLNDKSEHLFFATTSIEACHVSCAYEEPKLLGIDRWLGILAVESKDKSIGVVSIGTAITVDVVANKKHLGGHTT